MPARKPQHSPESLFDDLISEGISSFEGGGQISVIEFAEEFLFNGKNTLYPPQRAILKAFYGEPLTEDEVGILEYWVGLDRTTYVPGRKYRHLAFEAGRRASKSTLISIIALYEFYKLISLENPSGHYGLLPNSPIAIFVIAQSLEQVKETLFAAIKGYAMGSDYFKGLEASGKIEILAEDIRCASKNVTLMAKHTNSKALVGYSIKSLIIDEAARFEIDEFGNSKADEIWGNIGRACLHKDTPLLTQKGYQKAEDLLKNFDESCPPQIITFDPFTFEKSTTDRVKLWDNGVQDTRLITTFSGREESYTLNHPVLVWREQETSPSWVEVGNLKIGDLISSCRHLDLFSSKSEVSDLEARLIGYLQGDGGLTGASIRFTNFSPVIIQDLQYILDVEFPGCKVVRSNKTREGHWRLNKPAGWRNPVITRLTELGIERVKAPQKRIPLCITQGVKSTVANFLNGLFATDGYVIKSIPQHIGISLSSKEFIQDIQRELIRFGIYSTIRYRKTKGGCPNGYQVKDSECWVLEIRDYKSIETFSKEIGITSKDAKIQEVLGIFSNQELSKSKSNFNLCPKGVNSRIKNLQISREVKWSDLNLDYHWSRNRINCFKVMETCTILKDPVLEKLVKNFFWEPVVGIKEQPGQQTIGINVEGTGIIGNPILSHNTTTFGEEGHKIAISSAWEPGDYIEKLYEVAERDPTILGLRLRTWDLNLNPNMSEMAIKSSEEYIKDPITAALEFEGIRCSKKGTYMITDNVRACFKGKSCMDAQEIPLDITNKLGETRHYIGVQINRLEHLVTGQSFAHCDYGIKKDAAAFAVVSPIQLEEGNWGIKVDGLLGWKPQITRNSKNEALHRTVSFLNAEEVILQICKARRVMKMSFDQFQSERTIQALHMVGISTELMSTSVQAQALYYAVTRTLIDAGLLIFPKDSHWGTELEGELCSLIQIPTTGRIDHPKAGSKDLADAVSNSVYNCYLHMSKSGLMSALAGGVATIGSQARNKIARYQTGNNPANLKSGILKLKSAKEKGAA